MKRYGKKAFLLLIALIFTLILPSCGSNKVDISTKGDENTTATGTVDNATTAPTTDKENGSVLKQVTVKKKVVIVQVTADETREEGTKSMIKSLENGGYVDGKNIEITKIVMDFNEKAGADVVTKIKKISPDVVLVNELLYALPSVVTPLKDSGIPFIVNAGVDGFVDEKGMPRYDVTGVYLEPKDLQEKAFQLLNRICPLNGKKAVFITQPGPYSKESVEINLKGISGELKAFEEYKYAEEFEILVNKYNNDPEVGWTLLGYWPMLRKDGTLDPIEKCPQAEYWKKPTVTYWENGVSSGLLCGLGVDLTTACAQVGEMAVKMLDGENIKDIKAEEPRKTTILINKKRADTMRIQIPNDILGSAKIFTDYKGSYIK